MKHIFFKSVRKDGSSLYAIGKYKKKYKLGQTYTFNEKTPAHVFVVCKNIEYGIYVRAYAHHDRKYFDFNDIPFHDQQLIYNNRAEDSVAEKVLVCYGDLNIRKVHICDIDENWDFNNAVTCKSRNQFTSTEFTVIGQIVPTTAYTANKEKLKLKIINDIT